MDYQCPQGNMSQLKTHAQQNLKKIKEETLYWYTEKLLLKLFFFFFNGFV